MIRTILLGLSLLAGAPTASAQGDIQRTGAIEHRAANAVFPERVGALRRTSAMQYDAAGRDQSAGYGLRTAAGWLNLTVYIYPAPRRVAPSGRAAACRREIASNVREIRSNPYYRNVRATETPAPVEMPGTAPALTHHAAYAFDFVRDGSAQAVTSEYHLFCFVGGDWLVKYRATATAGFPIADAVRGFIVSGPWPGRGDPASTASARPGPGGRLRR